VRVKTHRKLGDGSYRLVIEVAKGDDREFNWGPPPDGLKGSEYEAMQVREAKLLLEDEAAQVEPHTPSGQGEKLATEGQTL
jgi:hypothetical protein